MLPLLSHAPAELIVSKNLIDEGHKLGDTGIDARTGWRAGAAAPGDNPHQGPGTIFLAHQGSTRVTLWRKPQQNIKEGAGVGCHRSFDYTSVGSLGSG